MGIVCCAAYGKNSMTRRKHMIDDPIQPERLKPGVRYRVVTDSEVRIVVREVCAAGKGGACPGRSIRVASPATNAAYHARRTAANSSSL
jgi:hypothetical protein